MTRAFCYHCGLPVFTMTSESERVFCCHACRFASRMVKAGNGDGANAFTLLRLSFGLFLALNVMMISILLYTGHLEEGVVPIFRWFMLFLSLPVMLILVYPFTVGAFQGLISGYIGFDLLIAAGSISAFTVSAISTIEGSGAIYFDTATMLPVLVTAGKLLEATAKRETGKMTDQLRTLIPRTAIKEEKGQWVEVETGSIFAGDLLRVLPGQRFPADGTIEDGVTEIHEAAFTGEFQPRSCGVGDEVLAGTVNGAGLVTVRAVRIGSQLVIHRIVELVQRARSTISPLERLTERASSYFTPAVIIIALSAGIWWGIYDPLKGATVALAVIVVACPCALGIATPLATSLALGRAAQSGIIVKGGEVLEQIGKLSVMFFDKTGTLTLNTSGIRNVVSYDPAVSEGEVIAWLAALEAGSSHPFAQVVLSEADRRGIGRGRIIYAREFPGEGIRGMVTVQGISREVIAGSAGFVGRALADPEVSTDNTPSVINVAWGGKVRGRVVLHDVVRAEARETVAKVKAAGIAPILLSGDTAVAAEQVAREIGIEVVEAPRRPDEKILLIENARKAGELAGMVGDGLNDAPALAAADVGIAVASGTELAKQAGNVVIMGEGLWQVPWLVSLSRFARGIIKLNLIWAFGYNAVMIAIAAAGFLHPLIAAIGMVVSSITVLLNSLRIMRYPDRLSGMA